MLNTRSKTAAVSAYVQGEKVYALQLFDKLTIDGIKQSVSKSLVSQRNGGFPLPIADC